jgi:DNA polymerase elongation subunit (family B)
MFISIEGIESLDYMRLHKKYSWADEPSWKLDAIGEKYVGVKKIEYDGNLNDLYKDDIQKFVEYNFRDVEILKLLDEKLDYIALTRNIAHKGKHNYSEVYANTTTQDGAISAYLLGQGIVPSNKEVNPQKKQGYAGGWLFCPEAGLYENMFDLDLTSLYPAIIRTINIGRETYVGRILDADDRNNRLGLNDLKAMDPKTSVIFETPKMLQEKWEVGKIVKAVEKGKYRVAANGSFFSSKKKSTLSVILEKWFNERVEYKNKMKAAYKAKDTEKGKYYYLMQYTMKILLNSLYGATAVPNFRYGMNYSILSEAITLSGHRIIQESALCANKYYNKIIEGEIPKEEFISKLKL